MMETIPRKYTKSHEWIEVREDGAAYVGITDYAQEQVTDVVFVELPKEGKELLVGGECAIVESVKSAFSIYSPVAGKVIKVNSALEEDPSLVNLSPYGDGWFFALEVNNQADLENLLDDEGYQAHIASEGAGH